MTSDNITYNPLRVSELSKVLCLFAMVSYKPIVSEFLSATAYNWKPLAEN